ncbi:MAG TPA: DUF4184 family protein [Burkholderiales bacterium]|nr:DUF4184 family protein [Burkholderiales bacterium]
MPYPFAHPAAVLPLVRPLGRFAVPSALAIGSMAPDLWYFVPFLERHDSHSLAGLAWFCLPAGLIVYALFHRILKQPLIALLSPRLGGFTPAAVPEVPLRAVIVSLLAGALTHLAWDALTHSYDDGLQRHNWLQHASTALGTMVLGWWSWRKLRLVPAVPSPLSPRARACILLALLAAAALAAWVTAEAPATDLRALRQFMRTAGFAAVQALSVALLVYCLLFQRKMLRRAA